MPTRTYTIDFTNIGGAALLQTMNALVNGLNQLNAASARSVAALQSVQAAGTQAAAGPTAMTQAITGLTAAVPALVAGLAEIGAGMERARQYAHEAAVDALKARDAAREVRANMPGNATTTQATQEIKDLMTRTGATQAEAIGFDEQFLGAVNNAQLAGNFKLNDQQTEELKVQALRFAVTNKVDTATMGKIMGTMGISQKVETVDDALSQMGASFQLATEGVGNLSPLFTVGQKLRGFGVRPEGGGIAKDFASLMAIVSTGSVDEGNPLATSRSIEQAFRDLSKPAVAKKLGIKPKDEFVDMIGAVHKALEEGRAKGDKGDLEILTDLGLTNQNANKKIIQFADNELLMRKRLASVPKLADADRVRQINDDFKAQNPDRFAKSAAEVAKLDRGEETRDLESMRTFAEAAGTRRNIFNRKLGNVAENILDVQIPGTGVRLNQFQDTARHREQDALISQAIIDKVPDAQKRFPDLAPNMTLGKAARGERLAEVLRNLTDDERRQVAERLEYAAMSPEAQRKADEEAEAKSREGAGGGALRGLNLNPGGGGEPQARVEAPDIREAAPMMLDAAKMMKEAMASRGGGGGAGDGGGRGASPQPVMPGRV